LKEWHDRRRSRPSHWLLRRAGNWITHDFIPPRRIPDQQSWGQSSSLAEWVCQQTASGWRWAAELKVQLAIKAAIFS